MSPFLQPGVWLYKDSDGPLVPFLSAKTLAAQADADRLARIKQHEEFSFEQEEGRRRARMKRDEAELSGNLDPEAKLFRDARLRPRVTEAHDFQPTVRIPIVQNLFYRNSLTWVAGQSGTFKSFVTADLAFRYGQEDMDYHGKRMTSGRSLLVIAEGAAGYADRKTAWEKEHGREVKNVSIYPAPLQLGDTLKEMPALRSYLEQERDAGRPFDLVLFDTQAMCTVGVDENTSEMNLVITILHRIREVNGACVMVVHHFGKNKTAGMRGSSMIYAAADTVCVLKRKEDEQTVLLSTAQADEGKQKDGITEADLLELELKAHPVGVDYFDDTVFSLVPVAFDAPSTPVTAPTPELSSLNEVHVTDKQMPYLRTLSFFRHHGAGQTDVARKMTDEGGVKVYGSLVRSIFIALEAKNLVQIEGGKWRLTALGGAVLMREQSARNGTETAWLERPKRRFRSEVSEPLPEPSDGTIGTISEPKPETTSDLQRNQNPETGT